MKVNGQQPSHLSELTAGKAQERGREVARTAEGQAEKTREAENRTSLTTSKVREAIRNEPDVQAGRVAEIRDKLKSGEYKISTEKLAANMLIASLKEDLDQP